MKITSLLLDRGADIEAEDHNQETPLFDAVRYGRPDTLALLLERGANPHHQNRLAQAPMLIANRSKKPLAKAVQQLLAKRA